MESQQSTQTQNDQFSELGQRMARMETKMDFVATYKERSAHGNCLSENSELLSLVDVSLVDSSPRGRVQAGCSLDRL